MNGINILLDTNIIIYLLSGDKKLEEILDGKVIIASLMSEMEVLAYPELDEKNDKIIREFLSKINIVSINESIKEVAIQMRRKYKVKLPDAIIAATAFFLNIPLITTDSDFTKIEGLNILKYDL
ncbi:VapC toxin family PIN domain ribonuclease [Marivirga lumbricoides]|uniref:VapC toxin family PIN domain ribonuclease n=1 Tax=Marivirga lumbricoides TaxID=1046115 RepID=A0A2T4DUQ9_9BACT|nr:VapC toxin family PIN domain ribonuclease [Marivirga lumbricoides]